MISRRRFALGRIVLACMVLVALLTYRVVERRGGWSKLGDWLDWQAGGESIRGWGYLEGQRMAVLAERSAVVKSVFVAVGDDVEHGQALVQLEDESAVALLSQAQSALEAAEAARDQLLGGLSGDQLAALELAVAAAREQARTAEQAYSTALSTAEPATRVRALARTAEVAQASAQLAEARWALARAGPSSYQVAAAEASVRAARARLRLAQLSLERLSLRSPLTGTVTAVLVRPGMAVSAGQPLLQLTRFDPLELVIYVSQRRLADVEVGQTASVEPEGYDHPLEGRVVAVAQEAEFTPKSVQTEEERENLVFAVTIRVPNEERRLRPGIPAEAKIHVD